MEQKLLDEAHALSFEGVKENVKTPAYYFTELPTKFQIDAITRLAATAKAENKFLIYELGYGNSLSPLDSAGAGKNRVVLAFDIQGQFPGNIRLGTDSAKIPDQESGSFAAFFKIDVRDVIKNGNPIKANLAYSIVPFPNLTGEMIKLGLELSDNVYVVPNHLATKEYPPEDAIKNLPLGFSGEILMLTKSEIEEAIGTSKSAYITTDSPTDKIPVVHAYLPKNS